MLKSEIDICRYETKSALFDSKSRYLNEIDKAKAARHQAYVDHVQKNRELRNGKAAFGEDMKMKWKDFIRSFTPSAFFLANGLYIAIIIFFIVCIIAAPLRGSGNLLSLPNIFTILEQSSTRMFYALGVAGLILLAGTDLSIGRMVALGSVTTGLILHPGMNIVTFFGLGPWDFSSIPMLLRLVMSLGLSVILCSAFIFGIESALYAIIVAYVMQVMVNKIVLMMGTNYAKTCYIISEKLNEIRDFVLNDLDKSGTLIEAKGLYSMKNRPMLMVVIPNQSVSRLTRMVHLTDPAAFLIIQETYHVFGEGNRSMEEFVALNKDVSQE